MFAVARLLALTPFNSASDGASAREPEETPNHRRHD
jgi:hypothetical protein